jgi:alpha-glucuronidase
MKKTQVMAELQVTQEYLGHSNHLVYLGPLWEEFFKSDTFAKGPGSTVAKVLEGGVFSYPLTGIAGVANTGDDRDWCGHPFAQANWYAFGRFAWDPEQSAKDLAEDWVRMTWGNSPKIVNPIVDMMMSSRETFVDYTTPLGLSGVFEKDLHYAPDPGMVDPRREDWSAAYYTRADVKGLGFDRTRKGSQNVDQYFPPLNQQFNRFKTCPEKYLLWFHHVAWDQKMKSGNLFWDDLVQRYHQGVQEAGEMEKQWSKLRGQLDGDRFEKVETKLHLQAREAGDWSDKCLKYFQTFSRRPFSSEKP